MRQAVELIERCKRLDHQQIIAHKPDAVAVLKDVAGIPSSPDVTSSTAVTSSDSIKPIENSTIKSEIGEPTPAAKAALLERRRLLVEALGKASMSAQVGKVFSTESPQHLLAFKDISHKLGLPQFDLVVGPNFSPQDGYHGIFISEQEVTSCLLPLPYDDSTPWQIRERHPFANIDQVKDLINMLSGGFSVR
jgi:hypothetical protein